MWKTTVHACGVEVGPRLRASIEERLRAALGAFGGRISHVHVRLYGDIEGTGLNACYVRVDSAPSGGLALGDTAPDIEGALDRAVSRIATAVARQAENGRSEGNWEGAVAQAYLP